MFARDYCVVTWDQRGFGLSTNRNGLANPRTATADLLAILDHLGVERAHVVGQSLGGWAALGLAIAHADRVRTPRARRHDRRHRGRRVGGRPRCSAPRDGPFNHPALSNEFCRREPGARAPLPPDRRAAARPERRPRALLRALGDVTFDDDAARGAHDPDALHRRHRRRDLPARLDRRRRGRACPARGSRRSTAPATRRTSSSPRRGTPWSWTSGAVGVTRGEARLSQGARRILTDPDGYPPEHPG